MKNLLAKTLSIVMVMCLLIGCGKSVDVKETEKKELTIDQGYWVVESLIMEGTEFSKEDTEALFGPLDQVLSIKFKENGTLDGVLFEEFISGTFTGTLNEFTVAIEGTDETMKGVYSEEENMKLIIQDGSEFILVHQEEMPDAIANNPWVTYVLDFTTQDTMAMSNFMSYGRYYIVDDVLYGMTHIESDRGMLGATPFYMKGDFPEFEETKILDNRGAASHMTMYEDYLYYILDYCEVCRVHPDGTGLETLYEGMCDYLQVHDGKLYFTDEDYHYVTTDLDGKNLEKLVEKEVYYPYMICSDWMIFQDDADGESLHLYNTTFGNEYNINYVVSHCPILDGKYLYYTEYYDDEIILCRIDMSDPDRFLCDISDNTLSEVLFQIDDEFIYTVNNNSRAKADWKELSGSNEDTYESELFVSEGYTIHHEYDSEGLIIGKYLMSKEKFGGSLFR